MPEGPEAEAICVCERCRHYVKALTALAPIRPDQVFLQDLATLRLRCHRARARLSPAGRNRTTGGDATPDAIGMSLKRQLLEQAVLSDPEPDRLEAWLLDRCLSAETASTGPMRAMAQEVLAEWRLTAVSAQFRDWLTARARSEDRTP